MTRIVSYVHRYKRPAQEAAESSGLGWSCDRHHEKEPPPKLEKRRLSFLLNYPAGATGPRNPAHRAMRNVTAT
jgi:hypothetical protein